ncbi:IPTL-CTERM sorting domain-containing protein [Brevundimonas sp. NPDC003935]|uniref:IPTL-CTERM sorting domain-containing protein n=1 Tax=unclassified Brevundimonas TaxID=2622653 RepID=UPI00368E1F82
MGQNFTATATGTVTEIQVRSRTNIATTVYFFNGAGSGATGSNASAVSSQAVTLVDQGSDAAGFQTIVLATPLPVVAGHVYTFAFDAYVEMSANIDSYAGGTMLSNYNNSDINVDLAFTVTQVAAPPAAVPTMTEWAMILFGTILAGGAALYIQRRRQFA